MSGERPARGDKKGRATPHGQMLSIVGSASAARPQGAYTERVMPPSTRRFCPVM